MMLSRHSALNVSERLLRYGRPSDDGETTTPPPPWTPASLAGLLGWYEARALTVGAGSPVALWPDLSGNSNDLGQATTSARPTLTTVGGGGALVVQTDGADDWMSAAALSGSSATITQGFLAVRFTALTVTSYGTPCGYQRGGPALCRMAATAQFGIGEPFEDDPYLRVNVANGTDATLLAVWSGSGASGTMYGPGNQVVSGSAMAVPFNSTDHFSIGRHGNSGIYAAMQIRAVLVGNVVPASGDIASLLAYLEALP